MKALRYDGSPRLVEVAPPRCEPGQAVVAVRMAGICATDLEVLRGYNGFVGTMGHEMVGVVEQCADAGWIGRRVAAEITVACGRCDQCTAGRRGHCRQRTVLGIAGRDGCFAERVAVPIVNLHAVPDAVDDRAAVFTEPLAAAYAIAEQVPVAGQRVAVVGDGKLGLLAALAMAERDAEVTLIGRHDRKLAIAAAVGIRTAREGQLAARSLPIVVEATGHPAGLVAALELVAPRGVLVLKSTFTERPTLDTTRIVVDEIRVVGSRCGPFATALAALAAGRVDPRPLLEGSYPLERGLAALEHAARPGTLKIALEIAGPVSPSSRG